MWSKQQGTNLLKHYIHSCGQKIMRIIYVPGDLLQRCLSRGFPSCRKRLATHSTGPVLLAVTPPSPAMSKFPSNSHLFIAQSTYPQQLGWSSPWPLIQQKGVTGVGSGCPTSEHFPEPIGLLKGEKGGGGFAAGLQLTPSLHFSRIGRWLNIGI